MNNVEFKTFKLKELLPKKNPLLLAIYKRSGLLFGAFLVLGILVSFWGNSFPTGSVVCLLIGSLVLGLVNAVTVNYRDTKTRVVLTILFGLTGFLAFMIPILIKSPHLLYVSWAVLVFTLPAIIEWVINEYHSIPEFVPVSENLLSEQAANIEGVFLDSLHYVVVSLDGKVAGRSVAADFLFKNEISVLQLVSNIVLRENSYRTRNNLIGNFTSSKASYVFFTKSLYWFNRFIDPNLSFAKNRLIWRPRFRKIGGRIRFVWYIKIFLQSV